MPDNDVQVTPLPTYQVLGAALIQVTEAANVGVLFPFVAFMVDDMGHGGSQIGYYAGGLAASFCAAQFCSSVMWGKVSDFFGRKPAIIWGTLGGAIGIFVFGTANVYWQAVLGRVISGFLCGNIGILKSFITEITDDTNRAKGFAYLSVAWSVGTVIAPIIGGFLCKPAEKFPHAFPPDGLFGEYPYLLPCLFCIFMNIVASIACYFTMQETRKVTQALSKQGVAEKSLLRKFMATRSARKYAVLQTSDDAEDAIELPTLNRTVSQEERALHAEEFSELTCGALNDFTLVEDEDEDSGGGGSKSSCDGGSDDQKKRSLARDESTDVESALTAAEDDKFSEFSDSTKSATSFKSLISSRERSGSDAEDDDEYCQCCGGAGGSKKRRSVLTQKKVLLSTFSYGALAMAYILWDESIPLILKLDRAEGGFQFKSTEIGLLMSISGGMMMLFTLWGMPVIGRKSKYWLYNIGCCGIIPLAFCWPLLATINNSVLSTLSATAQLYSLWAGLLLINFGKGIVGCIAFTAVTIQINHSVHDKHLGIVNGLGQSMASFNRALGPALGGVLWSVSVESSFVYLNFLAVGAVMIGCLVLNQYISTSLDFKKKRPQEAARHR